MNCNSHEPLLEILTTALKRIEDYFEELVLGVQLQQ